MHSSVYFAACKTAFLLAFGFAMSFIIAPSNVHANVIINHLGIFAHSYPDPAEGNEGGTVTGPAQSIPDSDGLPGDSLPLNLGADDNAGLTSGNGQTKPLRSIRVTPPRLWVDVRTLDVSLTDPPQTDLGIGLSNQFAPDSSSVPEPGTLGLLAAAFAVAGVIRRKR